MKTYSTFSVFKTFKRIKVYYVGLGNLRLLIDLGLLYASKSGGIVVGVFVLPWYQHLLGAEAFGVVAMTLSIQGFLLMVDFGTSTMVGRAVASSNNDSDHLVTWRAAESLLHIVYICLLIAAISLNLLFGSTIPSLQVVLGLILFWSLSVQNVGQSVLLAKRRYAVSGSIQIIGVLGKAAITLTALNYLSADLDTFLLNQALTSVVHMMITSWFCRETLNLENLPLDVKKLRVQIRQLAIRGRPLVIFGLAGASVLQLDKVIIPLFASPTALTPYFLASSLCITPISVLAGPINQYFFPSIIESISNHHSKQTLKLLQKLILVICVVVTIPSMILWLGRESIINSWLHHQSVASEVAQYVKILLPGIAIGALGYVPYNILVAHEDYRAHSILSAGMTIITLLATAFAASFGNILIICWIYAIYHSLSVVLIWLRAFYLVVLQKDNYVASSARFAIISIASFTAFSIFLTSIAKILFE